MDGRELFSYMKRDPELNKTKVIGISGKIDPSEEQSLFNLGFSAFIRKPFNIDEIKEMIFELIEN